MDTEFLLNFLTGNSVTGFLNTVGLYSAFQPFKDVLDKLIKTKQGKDTFEAMLSAAFFRAAYETISEKAADSSFWDSVKLCLGQSKIEKSVDSSFPEQYRAFPLYKEAEGIYQCYQDLFADLCRIMTVTKSLPEKRLNGIFKDETLERSACGKWDSLLAKMKNDYPDFNSWMETLRYEKLSKQTASYDRLKFFGADDHLLKREVDGEYWPQEIKIGGQSISARPDPLSSEKQKCWWDDLKNLLSNHVLFLIGPGGMGKSAFLVYLYQTVKQGWTDCPFGGVFLISLDTLFSTYEDAQNLDAPAFSNPDHSILLLHIAKRSGGANTQNLWNDILSMGRRKTLTKPILLLLDGLNEVQDKKMHQMSIYNQIISEISALGDKNKYPNVCLIITSRIETGSGISEKQIKKQVEDQLNDFYLTGETKWQNAILKGISDPLLLDIPVGEEMKALLQRPMYYKYFKECAADDLPKTQYEALSIMYCVLSQQSKHNVAVSSAQKIRECVWTSFLPVLAYHQWASAKLTKNEYMKKSAEELVHKCSLQLIKSQFKLSDPFDDEALTLARNASSHADAILSGQEQLLICDPEEETYTFAHQDYRDYLVAEYFLQRLRYIGKHFRDCPLESEQGRANWVDSMRLNTYGKDTLRLVYQALSFETKYVEYFSIDRFLDASDITPACIMWFTTAYQLSDMCRLASIEYLGSNLYKDTLTVLEPLVTYVCNEANNQRNAVLPQLSPALKFHLIEILMKSCELYRRLGDFQNAIEIIEAAKYICDSKTGSMLRVIDYNRAKVYLHEFMENGITDNLSNALNTLYKCAIWKGSIPPHRFSCIAFGMIIVSPHPRLKAEVAYQEFVNEISYKEHPLVAAFWAYYSAIFDAQKAGEGWLPRLYAIRQFLMLLAENKIQVNACDGLNFDAIDIRCLTEALRKSKFSVLIPETPSPIPSDDNLRMIRRFLNEAREFDQAWNYYLNGLIKYILDGKKDDAYKQFKKAVEKSNGNDFKSRLWLAYLNGNIAELEQAYQEGFQKVSNSEKNVDITSYHPGEYYDRDVGSLFATLKERMGTYSIC